ncbi:MAG: hypothetical protein H0W50_10120 [Parachlamydiaceae bacterium]|nr:hypothetical protein [Parachlamydiaceae bacterium]
MQILLATLLYKFKSVLAHHAGKSLELDVDQKQRLEAIQSYALMLAKSILENGDCQPNDAAFCRKLLPLHFLHALINSSVSPQELVDGGSLVTAFQELDEENKITKELEQQGIKLNNSNSLTLLRLGKIAVREETAKLYRDLILKLDHNGQEEVLKGLVKMLMKLHKLDMLSLWLNISFHNKPEIIGLLEDFKQQGPFYKDLAQKRKILNALNVSAFAQPKSFQTQWQILNKELLDYVKSNDLAERYNKSDSGGKLAGISLMNKLVDQFDLAIKALEGSKEYPKEKQLILFQTMLKGYSELANKWHEQFGFSKEIKKCLKMAGEIVHKDVLKNADLRFSKGFDVQAFGSSSGASKGRVVWPETLEDAFSAIHKELETMMRILNKNAVGEDLPMPPLLKKAHEKLRLGNAIGCDMQATGMTLHYSIPLREHGVQYHLSSETGSDKLKLGVRFSGGNENGRWDLIALFMVELKVFGKFDIRDFDINTKGVGYTFYLDRKDDFIILESILREVESASTTIASYGYHKMISEKVGNVEKELKPIEDPRLIVEQFEKNCGVNVMMRSRIVEEALKSLVEKDPSFVEAFLKKCWQTGKLDFFYNVQLPEQLLKGGHSENASTTYALQLLKSEYEDMQRIGLRLMLVVAKASTKELPITFDQISKILQNPKFTGMFYKAFEHALGLLDAIMQRGGKLEHFVPNLRPLLIAEKPFSDNGLKVLDLLAKYRDNYSNESREEIVREIQQLVLPEAIRASVDAKLSSIIL